MSLQLPGSHCLHIGTHVVAQTHIYLCYQSIKGRCIISDELEARGYLLGRLVMIPPLTKVFGEVQSLDKTVFKEPSVVLILGLKTKSLVHDLRESQIS